MSDAAVLRNLPPLACAAVLLGVLGVACGGPSMHDVYVSQHYVSDYLTWSDDPGITWENSDADAVATTDTSVGT